MSFMDRLKRLFGRAKGKAGPVAAKGVDKAATGVDKVTGGRFHDQIETAAHKVEGALDSGGDRN